MDTRELGCRHLLGLGALLLTTVLAYGASHAYVAPDPPRLPAPGPPTIDTHITEAANRYAVSRELVVAVIEVESQFNTRAMSHRGAQGLMQLMPETAATLGVRDAFDPRENIHGGVKHLRWLLDRFDEDVPTALAAYNAGERTVIKRRKMPRETRDYVKRVMERMSREQAKS
jgi:soluble lytic murein transglycosylase-like protein